MAQALFERAATGAPGGPLGWEPAGGHVHPEVVGVMRELGIDRPGEVPHKLDRDDSSGPTSS